MKSAQGGTRQEPRSLQPLLGRAGIDWRLSDVGGVLGDHVVSALIVQMRPTGPRESKGFA